MATPKELDWDDLSPQDFERLVYDLLSEMGFTNVDWRKGTPKQGFAADSGRDIEAELSLEDPDGNTHIERWFVQVEHHSAAVRPTDFEDALSWATAERPEVLLLAVSGLSNSSSSSSRIIEETIDPRSESGFGNGLGLSSYSGSIPTYGVNSFQRSPLKRQARSPDQWTTLSSCHGQRASLFATSKNCRRKLTPRFGNRCQASLS